MDDFDIKPADLFDAYLKQEGALTRAKMCAFLRDYFGYSYQEATDFIDAYFDEITKVLLAGEKVNLRGFGAFSVKDKAARKARNMQTGETIIIPARKVVSFKASSKLKKQINEMNK